MSFFHFSSLELVVNCAPDWELIFTDGEREVNPACFKFMQMAHAWKDAQEKRGGG